MQERPGGRECLNGFTTQGLRARPVRTYVVARDDGTIVGYYALAPGGVLRAHAAGTVRRNAPDPVPVIGRLAVHEEWAGQGIGTGLLKDAVLRSLKVAQIIGGRALLCHAIDDEAKRFYLKHGFKESPLEPLTLMLGLAGAGSLL